MPTTKTQTQVKLLASFGNPQHVIAAIVGISEPTLVKHYRFELNIGLAEANAAVATALYKLATSGDPRCIRASEFWLRTRAGWSDLAPATIPDAPPKGKKEIAAATAQEAADQGQGWGELHREAATIMPGNPNRRDN